jgi:hypothetical protein
VTYWTEDACTNRILLLVQYNDTIIGTLIHYSVASTCLASTSDRNTSGDVMFAYLLVVSGALYWRNYAVAYACGAVCVAIT